MKAARGRHYFSQKGAAAEQVAHDLARISFLTDWCYENPNLEDGKELCDLLVVFDDVCVVWQVKSLKLRKDGHYKAGEVEKNVRQAGGALRRLSDVRRPVTLVNPRRGNEEFDPSVVRKWYLVSVIVGDGEDFFPIIEDAGGHSVHMFTGDFMELALNELDTIGDFVDYLEAKEALLCDKHVIVLGGEEELLATYLVNGRSFDRFADATGLSIDSGCWDKHASSPEYHSKQKADEVSYAWDSIIDRAHESASPTYERVARELARLNRFERRCLGQSMFEAAVAAHEDHDYPIFRRTANFNGRTYVFLFMDDPERVNRQQELQALCYVARGKFPENEVVIGIATEKVLRPGCSYDYCLMDLPEWSVEDDERALEISRAAGFYENAIARGAYSEEYPTDDAPITTRKIGRNEKCPCGSGRKHKRCCGS